MSVDAIDHDRPTRRQTATPLVDAFGCAPDRAGDQRAIRVECRIAPNVNQQWGLGSARDFGKLGDADGGNQCGILAKFLI
jgi:hypothetical protein